MTPCTVPFVLIYLYLYSFFNLSQKPLKPQILSLAETAETADFSLAEIAEIADFFQRFLRFLRDLFIAFCETLNLSELCGNFCLFLQVSDQFAEEFLALLLVKSGPSLHHTQAHHV